MLATDQQEMATSVKREIPSSQLKQAEFVKKPKTEGEREEFLHSFEIISQTLYNELAKYNLPENGIEWFKKMIIETVPGGKMNRGLTVASSLSSLLNRSLSDKEKLDAHVLGWCIEMLQAFFLIQDDIMDSSVTRRGQPCWYRRENVGMVAINDSMMIEMSIYKLLKKYFRDHRAYSDFIELFHETTFQTELGQLMDLITAPENDVDLDRFSIKKHAYIVEYKTAYYSFYLPIALAMRYAGITDEKAYEQAKSVLISLGEYFQVQDDYLDCYGLPEVIGKIGTDIEDNKSGWLIVQALTLASKEQRKILDENYGQKKPENVKLVKQVYKELDIEGVYHKYEEDSYSRISLLIEKVDGNLIPRQMFTDFMNRIYKRKI